MVKHSVLEIELSLFLDFQGVFFGSQAIIYSLGFVH